MTILTEKPSKKSSQLQTRPSAGSTSRPTDAALAEAIGALRGLERVAFDFSRNSTTGLFFAQQKLLLLRLANGKPPTRDELVRLASCVCSSGISSELQESAA